MFGGIFSLHRPSTPPPPSRLLFVFPSSPPSSWAKGLAGLIQLTHLPEERKGAEYGECVGSDRGGKTRPRCSLQRAVRPDDDRGAGDPRQGIRSWVFVTSECLVVPLVGDVWSCLKVAIQVGPLYL